MNGLNESTRQYRESLTQLSQTMGSPEAGFFGPSSLVWRVNQEAVLHIAGPRALLLQLAHPMVAQGVGDHSNFREDFWGRTIRTFATVYSIVFGTQVDAIKASSRTHAVHQRITGALTEDVGRFVAGTPYAANDPNLLRWVYATLVDSSLITFQNYVTPKNTKIVHESYLQMRKGAPLFGVPSELLAPTWPKFRHWMNTTIASDEIAVSQLALSISEELLAGPPGLKPIAPGVRIMCAGMLPEKLRKQFQLTWDLQTRVAFRLLHQALCLTVRRIPQPLRTVPIARTARRRCRQAHNQEAAQEFIQRLKRNL